MNIEYQENKERKQVFSNVMRTSYLCKKNTAANAAARKKNNIAKRIMKLRQMKT
jgi:hypothetical protein